MKRRSQFTIYLFLTLGWFVSAQNGFLDSEITLTGKLLDQENNQPVVYANIGFVAKGIGTISNENGVFKLTFKKSKVSENEELQISTLGYETLKISLARLEQLLLSNRTIYLAPEPLSLNEVFITNEKRRESRLGVHRESTEVVGSWQDSLALGGEIATKIRIRKVDTRLLDLKFNILKNLSDSLKVRVNIYNYNKRFPQEKLLKKNIFHTISRFKGQETIDLRPYDIRVHDDIVVSIELVKVYGDKIDFIVSGEAFNGTSFKRYVSQDKWERFSAKQINFSLLCSTPLKRKKKSEIEELEEEYEDEAYFDEEEITTEIIEPNWNKIFGVLTHNNIPISGVRINIKGTNSETLTDESGQYQLKAKPGDVIEYYLAGFYPVKIIIEDVTSELTFELTKKN
ncbi:MAG: carboxypeptidase-like regulatory domain-containing protein [bacterium]